MHHLKPLLGVGQLMLQGLQAPLAVRQLMLCLLQLGPGASKDVPLQLQTGLAVGQPTLQGFNLLLCLLPGASKDVPLQLQTGLAAGQPTLQGFNLLLLAVQHTTHTQHLHLVTLQKITLVRSLNRPACVTAESLCSCKLNCILYSVSQFCCK